MIPTHIRLAYLVEMALRKLSTTKNLRHAILRHSRFVKALRLYTLEEDFTGYYLEHRFIKLNYNKDNNV